MLGDISYHKATPQPEGKHSIHIFTNDKHKIKVTKKLKQPKYLMALIQNQPLLKTRAFHKLLEIFLKVARNSSKITLKSQKLLL